MISDIPLAHVLTLVSIINVHTLVPHRHFEPNTSLLSSLAQSSISNSRLATMQLFTLLLTALFAVTAFAQWGRPAYNSAKPQPYHSQDYHSQDHERTWTSDYPLHSVTQTMWQRPTAIAYPPHYPTHDNQHSWDEDHNNRGRSVPRVLMA